MNNRDAAWGDSAGSGGRVVLGLVGAVAGMALLAGCGLRLGADESFTDDQTINQQITAVLVNTGSGELRIRTGSGQTSVHRNVRYQGERPGVLHRVEGSTLVLDPCGRDSCGIDYEVVVPAGAKVTGEAGSGNSEITAVSEVNMRAGSGNFTARGIPGRVTVEVGSGNITLEDVAGPATVVASSGNVTLNSVRGELNVRTSSGEVTGKELAGNTVVEANSGEVDLDMAAARDVRVSTGSGGITVRVPAEPYQVSVQASSGQEDVSVATDPTAPRRMDLRANSGSITVSPR